MKEMILQGDMIYLKELTNEDASEQYLSWLNDPEINKFLESRYDTATLTSIDNYIKNCKNDKSSFLFGIFDNTTSNHIGNIKLTINFHHKRGNIGILIGERKLMSKGFATNAVKLLTDFGFERFDLHKINAGMYIENKASTRIFEKNGYKVDAVLKEDSFSDGRWIDGMIMYKLNTRH